MQEVDAVLSSYCGIHLREQRSRDEGAVHTSLEYGGGESCHIRRDAAAHCEQQREPVGAVLQQPAAYVHHGGYVLVALVRSDGIGAPYPGKGGNASGICLHSCIIDQKDGCIAFEQGRHILAAFAGAKPAEHLVTVCYQNVFQFRHRINPK